ncbi:DUF3152 domain-containing protein [Streptomyces tendae]
MAHHPAPEASTSGRGGATTPSVHRRPGRSRRRGVMAVLLVVVALSVLLLIRFSDQPSRSAESDGFLTAKTSAPPVGTGTVRRFKVRVEEGIGVSADDAAREVYRILADRRSWTADGRDAFQLVSAGDRDFVVVIASPATVDRICGAAGLETGGEVNCDVGDRVFVNVKRWNTGSPRFPGPLDDYRALIINHEVGHRLGHGHEGCPGPGRPAPAMMQQIDGLDGCEANAWPYDAHGTYLGGPRVP